MSGQCDVNEGDYQNKTIEGGYKKLLPLTKKGKDKQQIASFTHVRPVSCCFRKPNVYPLFLAFLIQRSPVPFSFKCLFNSPFQSNLKETSAPLCSTSSKKTTVKENYNLFCFIWRFHDFCNTTSNIK